MTIENAFHRWMNPSERGISRDQVVDASEAERVQLAAWLDIPAVHAFHAELQVTRTGADRASVQGSFVAELDLVCGVSLDPFPERISGVIAHEFRKPHAAGRQQAANDAAEIEVSLADEEVGEWRPQGIDLGALLAEELSLALPDFPRKPGAQLEAPPVDAELDEKPNPFAVLSRLSDGDGDGQG